MDGSRGQWQIIVSDGFKIFISMHLSPHVQYMALLDGDIMSLLPWYGYKCAACVAMPKATNK